MFSGMRNRRSKPDVNFKAHLEYIYHITCDVCKNYFTYATMEENFPIDKGIWYCPKCGQKGNVEIEKEL